MFESPREEERVGFKWRRRGGEKRER